jgi:hypothetical protein
VRPSQSATQGQEENELLHETIVLLGYYCLQRGENQGIMCYGNENPKIIPSFPQFPSQWLGRSKSKSTVNNVFQIGRCLTMQTLGSFSCDPNLNDPR